ncbi:HTH-type, GntR family transcriptional regulator [Shouchella lehensis G1]|uniref:HTH-type, GntR family transcriptional regulator n=1 Tax=Shouchella lehensis G1 TaxID=1246626 RepID=A0A060LZY0_9BACI|nr:HTH-type, GntR family transcriptional regulator [Shouchella lehensis G1]
MNRVKKLSVERKTLASEAYHYLYKDIITLKYKPGQMIYENDIAKELGISRTPVREAIHLLASEEFLAIKPQKGIQVQYISKKKVQESYRVRESLEVTAFKEVANLWDSSNRIYKAAKKDLLAIIAEQRYAAENDQVDDFYQYDEVFHDKVLDICGNQTLTSIVRQVRGHVNRMRYLEFFETREMDRIIEDHDQLVTLIEQNNILEVEKLLVSHLRNVSNYYDDIMRKYPDYFNAQS